MLHEHEDHDPSLDLPDPLESSGIAVPVTEILALCGEQTGASLGLVGHQPSEKITSSRFDERPCVEGIKVECGRKGHWTYSGCMYGYVHLHAHVCIHHTHTPYSS